MRRVIKAMLIMASVIRVGQSKFVTVPIDEDSNERIMNCIQTLSELKDKPVVHEIFLKNTKAAYSKMVTAQEVVFLLLTCLRSCTQLLIGFRKRLWRRAKPKKRKQPLYRWTIF